MNFLELAQATARESGAIPNGGVLPLTTVDQTGRLAKAVSWTAQSWVIIQNSREDWDWMLGEFEGALVTGKARYTPFDLGITERFASWREDAGRYRPMTMYRTLRGVADEGAIQQSTWEYWRTAYGRGAQPANRPTTYAISPARELCVGQTPDASYTLRGEYRKAAQVLRADTDTPECPERFHMMIAWHAVMLLHAHDEGFPNVGAAKLKYDAFRHAIEVAHLPQVRVGSGALA